MKIHEKYIKRCIQLAKNGLGTTYSNPMVGSVVVHNNKIIGEGWHYKAGMPHAEVNAINSVKDKSLLKEATIYVSLEPCSHYGKTPPCADLIIQHQIPNVVIGCVDSFSKVSGKGIERLKTIGCNVLVGVLEKECLELNKRFFTYHNKKRPYIILKWAETSDGFIAPNQNKGITWITNKYSRQLVHKLRTKEQAILVGTNTALIDNPKLNSRDWEGTSPVRVVIDRNLQTPITHHIFDNTVNTIIITEKGNQIPKSSNNVNCENVDFSTNIPHQICDVLYKYELQSLIIEGGAITLQEFINSNLWDEAYVFKGSSLFKEGIKAPILKNKPGKTISVKTDTLSYYYND